MMYTDFGSDSDTWSKTSEEQASDCHNLSSAVLEIIFVMSLASTYSPGGDFGHQSSPIWPGLSCASDNDNDQILFCESIDDGPNKRPTVLS